MRSIEAERATIRATSTGISAFIDAEGKLVERGPQFEPVVMTREIQPRTGATPYVRFGNTPVIVLCAALLAAACGGPGPDGAVESPVPPTPAEAPLHSGKPVVYQVFTRLYGNTVTTNKPWGTLEENGVGKFSDFDSTAPM